MDNEKKQYNKLLARLLKGMQYLENESVEYETRLKSLGTWTLIKDEMNMLLEQIGEMPGGKNGKALVPFVIGGDENER